MDDPRLRFYSELDDETAKYWLTFVRPQSTASQLTKLTYTAYMHHPLAYLVCTKDQALFPDFQRAMIDVAKKQGLTVDVYETDADHSPWLSREAETIEVINKVVAAL